MKFRIKKILSNLLVVFTSSFVAILIFEFFLRIAKIEYPIFQKHDPILGFDLRPNASGHWVKEGRGFVKINSDGLRDLEHNLEKKKNVFRIAILGDSFSEARSVDLEKTFWYLAQEKLRNCNSIDKNIEVINFGVTGFSTGQQFLTLKHKVWKYDPDLILLAFFPETNIPDNVKDLAIKKYRPFFSLKDDKLIIDNSFRQTKTYKMLSSFQGRFFLELTNYSRIAQLLKEVYIKNHFDKQRSKQLKERENKKLIFESEIKEIFYPKSKIWIEAWDITEKIIIEINKEITNKRKKFILVSLSVPFQVHPKKDYRENFQNENHIKDIFYPEKRLAQLGKKNGFKVFNLAEKLQSHAIKFNKYLHGFNNNELGKGHLNEYGHNISSELISNEICKLYKL